MTTQPPSMQPGAEAVPTCYRHPERETYVRCQRCDRPICPDCMRDAAVGFQCVECVREGNKTVRQAKALFGGGAVSVPRVTWTLLVVNVVAYFGEIVLGNPFVAAYNTSPGDIENGEWWRLITGAFLHMPPRGAFAITHILFNMWALWAIGPELERRLGHLRFAALYLLSALGGSVAVFLFSVYPSVGASGAIYGLFGALFVVSRRLGYDARGVIWLIGINVVLTFTIAGISWQGHLGGLVVGTLVAAIFAYAPERNRTVIQLAGAAAVLVALVLTVVLGDPYALIAEIQRGFG
ncbi:rhomboid family intramembrane serine protease [Acrocarpospora phusangensis]|uniref:Rhomboid family intramembrane serine protease n=1 Tax=Acrocarpospora phusangensis TaxID=1070424 RepID=A0A919Q7F0_9ACTN|nr:rhomboid family intramembrane serine protease [Acrocarpospora phusangensis]GIH23348.1 rhomboid family intramembrane serine protease [Acrocarpospora phusangensis]